MTESTTPTGQRTWERISGPDVEAIGHREWQHILRAIEREAAAVERERLIEQGWHEPYGIPDCGPIKAQPHEHTYYYATTGSKFTDPPPLGVPCVGCGHLYGDPEEPTDDPEEPVMRDYSWREAPTDE